METNNQNGSQFLVVNRDDVQQIEALSRLFPRLTNMIRNNTDKNLVVNFRDEKQRSLIVMIVSGADTSRQQVSLAS